MNVNDYHDCPDAKLHGLHTRALLALLKMARGRAVCECCGEANYEWEREFNRKQFELHIRTKAILATREHIPSAAESKSRRRLMAMRREKKVMRY